MKAVDGLEGRGVGLKAVWHNDRGHVAVNVDWQVGTGATTGIKIVKKASDPGGVEAIAGQLHDKAKFTLTINFEFNPEKYWHGVLRSGYLAAFERFGYAYVVSDNARLVRRVLDGTDPTPEVILQAYPEPDLSTQTYMIPISREPSCIVAILRLRSATTRYLAVLLPGRGWQPLTELAARHRELRLNVTRDGSEFDFRFSDDPVKVLRETRFSAEGAEE